MRDVDVAWVAGIIEGEGSFVCKTSRHPDRIYRSAMVAVTMCDADVIHRLLDVTGVGVVNGPYARKGTNQRKPCWTWQVQKHDDALAIMALVRPWMGERRGAKIDELLAADYGTERLEIRP